MSDDARHNCRVFILYRYALFARGLQSLLSKFPDLEIVGVECDPRRALERLRATQPDVLLVEGQEDSLSAIDGVAQAFLDTLGEKIVTFSIQENVIEVFRHKRLRVRGAEDLVEAIRTA